MIKIKEDLVGRCFGRLKVIARAEDHVRPKRKNRTPTKSCGCLARELIKERSKKFNRYAIVGYGIEVDKDVESKE